MDEVNKLNEFDLELEFWERTGNLPEEQKEEFEKFCRERNE